LADQITESSQQLRQAMTVGISALAAPPSALFPFYTVELLDRITEPSSVLRRRYGVRFLVADGVGRCPVTPQFLEAVFANA
jgi:hypothetical protein